MTAVETSVLWLLVLGAVHGINPAMGWLFAVSLGLQQGSGRAIWRALPPLAVGHALAIAAAVIAAGALGLVLPPRAVRWLAAAALLASGALQLLRHRHPRLGGMRVGAGELTAWSFLMASAHGAGLMVVPLMLGSDPGSGAALHGALDDALHAAHGAHATHAAHAAQLAVIWPAAHAAVIATVLHTAGYLAVAGAIAMLVYAKLGLKLLRTAWFNINLAWAVVLVVTAVLTLLP